MNLLRMLEPVFTGLKKDSQGNKEGRLYKMSTKERLALKEARRIVSNCSVRIEKPFRYGQGNLENSSSN